MLTTNRIIVSAVAKVWQLMRSCWVYIGDVMGERDYEKYVMYLHHITLVRPYPPSENTGACGGLSKNSIRKDGAVRGKQLKPSALVLFAFIWRGSRADCVLLWGRRGCFNSCD